MKRIKLKILAALLCVCLLCSLVPAAQSEEAIDFELPFGKEALLSALYEADIATIRQAISLELITCEELTGYYLQRIEDYNAPYNCFITICDDALDVARQRDEALAAGNGDGLLFGIPIIIKDNMDLAGYYTTNGHEKEDSPIADSDAYVVSRLLEEGAVIIAKANMSTDAQTARASVSQAVGQTKNAYNTLIAAGGSSGGSAVATSLNFAAASLGTDTNASLRLPAALNGCVALRTTFGLIPLDGIKILNSTRDVPGAITRTVYDQAIMLDVLTDNAYGFTENLNPDALEGLRIGILSQLTYSDSSRSGTELDDEVLAAFENAAEELRQCGAEVITVSMKSLFQLADPTLTSNKQSLKDDLHDAYMELLEENELDALIFPTYSSAPIRTGTDENGTYWDLWDQPFINNCQYVSPSASVPEISVPIGVHSMGAGIGMEIVSTRNSEQLLLDIAYSYTLRFDHRQLPEGAPDTYSASNAGSLTQLLDAYFAARDAATAPTTVPETEPPTEATQAPQAAPDTTPPPREPGETQPAASDGEKEEFPIWLWAIPVGLVVLVTVLVILQQILAARARRRRRRKRRRVPDRDNRP